MFAAAPRRVLFAPAVLNFTVCGRRHTRTCSDIVAGPPPSGEHGPVGGPIARPVRVLSPWILDSSDAVSPPMNTPKIGE